MGAVAILAETPAVHSQAELLDHAAQQLDRLAAAIDAGGTHIGPPEQAIAAREAAKAIRITVLAEQDEEPSFTLRARDPLAGFLVSIWSSVRIGDVQAATAKFTRLVSAAGRPYIFEPDVTNAEQALDVALQMFAWRDANVGKRPI